MLDRTVERVLFLFCLLIGAVQAIGRYSFLDPDGLSYLDISDAWFRHDWSNCINTYWSPLFPALIAALRSVLPRSSYFEFSIVHLAGFLCFVGSLFCFRLLVHELEKWQVSSAGELSLPCWMFRGLAYTLFSWASLSLIRVYWPTPDMLVSAVVYLSAFLMLKLRRSPQPYRVTTALGGALALGYWSKTAFFVTALLFLAALIWSLRSSKLLRSGLVAVAAFALLSAPLIVAVSAKTHHLTIGETGKLNYSWNVNENTMFLHWQGEVPASGRPLHPTRKVLSDPPMYEYGSPVAGTYPPWYDPSYWYAGVQTDFNPAQQVAAVARNLRRLGGVLWRYPGSIVILICFYGAVFLLGEYDGKRFRSVQFLFVPACATIGVYLLVAVRPRYVAPFLVLALLSFLVGAVPRSAASLKRVQWWLLAGVSISAAFIAWGPARDTFDLVRHLRARAQPHDQWAIAQAIERAGVPEGSKVGSVGWEFFPFWARAAHDRVVAEVYDPERFEVWTTQTYRQHVLVSSAQWDSVLNVFRSAGARVVVARQANIAPALLSTGWTKVPGTDVVFFVVR